MTEKVVIQPSTKVRLIDLGRKRNAMKDPSWTRRKSDVFNDAQVDALGCIGEWPMSEFLDTDMDWNVHAHGDKGVDLTLNDGRTMAVKFNHRWKGYLMVEERHNDTETNLSDLSTDLIGLVHGSCNPPTKCYCKELLQNDESWSVWIAGYLPTKDFISLKQYANWGLGGRHYVRVNQLLDIAQLKKSSVLLEQSTADWIDDYDKATRA